MKSKFLRILSAILILASLVSMFAIFAAAETSTEGEGEEEEQAPRVELLYNRSYDEGWDIKNGLSVGNPGSVSTMEYETTADYKYNYFWRFEVQSKVNTYHEFSFGDYSNVGSVFEFDIKSDDLTTINGLIHFGTPGSPSSNRNNWNLMQVKDNQVQFGTVGDPATDSSKGYESGSAFTLTNEWMHVAFVFDFTYDHDGNPETEEKDYFQVRIYYGETDNFLRGEELTHHATLTVSGRKNAKGLNLIRIGTSNEPESNFGTSVCFDNVQCYNGSNQYGVFRGNTTEKGTKINPNYPKTVDILTSDSDSTKGMADYVNECYALKLNVDHAYWGNKYYTLTNDERNVRGLLRGAILENEKGEAYGAPFMDADGVIWVALESILEYCGYPFYMHEDGIYVDISTGTSSSFISTKSTTATVDGKRVELLSTPSYVTDADGNEYLAMNMYDVQTILIDYYVDYDPTGLIVISGTPNDIINRDLDLETMMSIMKNFVFEYATPEEIVEDAKNYSGLDHPYLYTNEEQAEEIRRRWLLEEGDEGYDPLYDALVSKMVENGYWAYEVYSKPDANGGYDTYVGLKTDSELKQRVGASQYEATYSLEMPYQDAKSPGYDPEGGRSNLVGRTNMLQYIAGAYLITKDVKLLYCAYDMALRLGEWDHWGPGHFLNVADGTSPYAIFYDWCYDGYVELYNNGQTKYDVKVLAEILYNKSTYEGILSTKGIYTSYISSIVGQGGSLYPTRDNNWNAVCSGGMITGALALLDDERYVADASWLISSNIRTLMEYGMGQYAPDGDYIESPGYWAYGTNNFFEMTAAMWSALGTTYNTMDCWGINTTCNFACHTESSDFRTFNFHDGGMGSQETQMFMFVAEYFGQSGLAQVRISHLENGKTKTIYDVLYYPDATEEVEPMSFDYYSKALDLYCARSSWDSGALYVGMMGGINKLGHGQIDAGSFVYHNEGTVWLIDLGTENYNAAGFWPESTRYRYYVMKPEGNNTITLTSDPDNVPYGQVLTSTAPSVNYESNEHGSFMVLDMTETLGGNASSWMRGMMLTNDRKTVIVQDEIYFEGVQSGYWFAHYRLSSGYVQSVELSSDRRTAYLVNYNGQVLRMKIESSRADLRFEKMDCYTFVHTGDKGTFGPEYSQNTPNSAGQKVSEHDRSYYNKLAIKFENTPSVTFAVVIELIDPKTMNNADKQIDLGYTFTALSDWKPTADMRGTNDDAIVETTRKAASLSTLSKNTDKIANLYETGRAYTSRTADLYSYLTDLYYTSIQFYPDELVNYTEELELFEQYKAEYDAYIGTINQRNGAGKQLATMLMGV